MDNSRGLIDAPDAMAEIHNRKIRPQNCMLLHAKLQEHREQHFVTLSFQCPLLESCFGSNKLHVNSTRPTMLAKREGPEKLANYRAPIHSEVLKKSPVFEE
jgi:hypothetical protein